MAAVRPRRSGFTLIELMVVIVLIGVLVALLLPAITGAVRTANNATVTGEFQTLSTALADFRAKFGSLPPSRIMLSESGKYDVDPTGPAGAMVASANGSGGADITRAALARRSMDDLRKLWPKLSLTAVPTATAAPGLDATNFYDFNGNGIPDPEPYVLEGDECLVFFLGGVPLNTGTAAEPSWSMSGWGKAQANPFSNNMDRDDDATPADENATLNPMYNGNRSRPLFEFAADRLVDPDTDATTDPVRFPAYMDRLGTGRPIAYFSSHGGGRYDPNDCNAAEMDDNDAGPLLRRFRVGFPVVDGSGTVGRTAISAPPNPYSSSAPTAGTVQWAKAESFQLLSAGRDGLWGPGGQYDNRETATTPLPNNPAAEVSPTGIDRTRENDNLANFAGGPLR